MPRLAILTDKEQIEFDYPPTMTAEARAVCCRVATPHCWGAAL